MDRETTTVSVTGLRTSTLDMLKDEAHAAGYSRTNAGVLRYCLQTVARDKRPFGAFSGTSGTEVSDGV